MKKTEVIYVVSVSENYGEEYTEIAFEDEIKTKEYLITKPREYGKNIKNISISWLAFSFGFVTFGSSACVLTITKDDGTIVDYFVTKVTLLKED